MKTIFLSVQTGMVVRDLLRCGPLERVLSHPDARVVLLTPGRARPGLRRRVRPPTRVDIVPHEPYAPDADGVAADDSPLAARPLGGHGRRVSPPRRTPDSHARRRTSGCSSSTRRRWWFRAIRCGRATRT